MTTDHNLHTKENVRQAISRNAVEKKKENAEIFFVKFFSRKERERGACHRSFASTELNIGGS